MASTMTQAEVTTSARRGLLSSARARVASVLVSAAMLVVGTVSSAQAVPTLPADPTGGAGDTFITGLQTWVLTYGVPLIFGLLLLGTIIRVAVKYVKRGARSI